MTKKHVIIGNSAAALSAARAIRSRDKSCAVRVISAEDSLAYSPVLLPYYLSGKIGKHDLIIADRNFYKQSNIDLLLGSRVGSVNAERQIVVLEDGTVEEFDDLLIASGASPAKLKAKGADTVGVMTLRTMDDAERILEASRTARHVLIAGAGLASLEIANALTYRDRTITVMAKSAQILSRNADLECAGILQRQIEATGTGFLFGREVAEIVPYKGRLRVTTDCGDSLAVDLVIAGKGVKPNVEFLHGSGVKVNQGITVNERMQTSVPNIYAAGDVAEAKCLLTMKHRIFATWPSACIEGKVAGLNMAGQEAELAGEVVYNIVPIFGRTAAFMGESKANSSGVEELKVCDEKKGVYRKVIVKADRIIGAILMESLRDVGIVLDLMVRRIDVSNLRDKLANGSLSWGKVLHDVPHWLGSSEKEQTVLER